MSVFITSWKIVFELLYRPNTTQQRNLGVYCLQHDSRYFKLRQKFVVKISDGELTKDLRLPTPPRTLRRRAGGQLKTWATTVKADLKPLSGLQVFDHARWRKDWVNVSSELPQDSRAWSASVWDVVNSIGYAGSTRLGLMPTQVKQVMRQPKPLGRD